MLLDRDGLKNARRLDLRADGSHKPTNAELRGVLIGRGMARIELD